MATATRTVTLRETDRTTAERGGLRAPFVLPTFDVLVDGAKVATVTAYTRSPDLTPYARTRRDGALQRRWMAWVPRKPGDSRLASRKAAVASALRLADLGLSYDAAAALAATAKVAR